MSEKRAKRLRREARERGDLIQPKRYFTPFTLPLPSGKVDPETNEQEMVETYIPRTARRKFMRQFMTDLRKGRVPLPQQEAK